MSNFIEISEKKYRVEVNWNAITKFCEQKGWDSLENLDNLSKLKFRDVLSLLYLAIEEGERMDGRVLSLSMDDIGAAISIPHIVEFTRIFKDQCTAGVDDGKKK